MSNRGKWRMPEDLAISVHKLLLPSIVATVSSQSRHLLRKLIAQELHDKIWVSKTCKNTNTKNNWGNDQASCSFVGLLGTGSGECTIRCCEEVMPFGLFNMLEAGGASTELGCLVLPACGDTGACSPCQPLPELAAGIKSLPPPLLVLEALEDKLAAPGQASAICLA